MTFLEKEFRFEAAHRLGKGYKGKCANIHGHSWVVRVKIMQEFMTIPDEAQYDMVLDYATMKKICSPIIDLLDHSIILYREDEPLVEFCHANGYKAVLLGKNPTSETIAEYLFGCWEVEFELAGVKLVEVVVEETCTAKCCYTGPVTGNVMDSVKL